MRGAGQCACPHVQNPFMLEQFAVPHIERLIVDKQAQQLAVGDVDDRLAGLRIAEPRLGVRQRTNLVERVQICARQTVWFALVEIASHADVAVRQGEQRLRFGQKVQIERGFADMPRLHGEHVAGDHCDINSARSVTTTSAPLRRNASA